MKKIISIVTLVIMVNELFSQNIGIGTTEPKNKLHVLGSMLVSQPTVSTNTLPTPAQTHTLVHATTITTLQFDSTWYVYDPGGIAGNYNNNITAYFVGYANTGSSGYELTFTDMDLGTGDSLIIREYPGSPFPPMFAVGNGYTTTGKVIVNGWNFHLTFKSNGDGNTGRGFALKLKRLYTEYDQLQEMKNVIGSSMYYDVKKFAFRAGWTNNSAVGNYSFGAGWLPVAPGSSSIAMGENAQALNTHSVAIGNNLIARGLSATALGNRTEAVGDNSTAFGNQTNANGLNSTALGYNTTAAGENSTSMGNNTTANGLASMAMGQNTKAIGSASTAMGFNTTASGSFSTAMGLGSEATGSSAIAIGDNAFATANNSIALGSYASTNGQQGSFVIGDNSTFSYLNSAVPNGFRARFAAGYGFYTSANLSSGVWLAAGGNSWLTISDQRLKENFLPVDGEGILKSIGSMPQYTWNYKTQDPKTFRHYGPMAQDFYKAFGNDDLGTIGCDSMINQHDFLGVNFIAIQALITRSDKMESENTMLKNKLSMIEQKLGEMEKLIRRKKQSNNDPS